MMALVLAHMGHWTTSLAFFGPVVLFPAALYALVLIERRRAPADEEDGAGWAPPLSPGSGDDGRARRSGASAGA